MSGRRGGLALDWKQIQQDLDRDGYARLPGLLSAEDCGELGALYADDTRFRSTVSMQRHRFGAGEYRYFARPLPRLVSRLRSGLYPGLSRIANAWSQALGSDERFPASHRRFLERCAAAGQTRPTPLLLRYHADGFNCLHQDLYGEVAFPLQLTCLLSDPRRNFAGGEFLLVEARARQQSRGEAIALGRGEGILFPTRTRPVLGARGVVRSTLRHGLSRVRSGQRLALGVIFHDAT